VETPPGPFVLEYPLPIKFMLPPVCMVRFVAVMLRLCICVSVFSGCVSVPAMVMFVALIGVPPCVLKIVVVPDICWMLVAWNLVPVWFMVLAVMCRFVVVMFDCVSVLSAAVSRVMFMAVSAVLLFMMTFALLLIVRLFSVSPEKLVLADVAMLLLFIIISGSSLSGLM